MKLVNRTNLPDDLLEPVLLAAAKGTQARTSGVVVVVSPSYHGGGTAYHCSRTRDARRGERKRWRRTDGGMFTVRVADRHRRPVTGLPDGVAQVEDLFRTARHEWVHIRDYQRLDAGVRNYTTAFDKPLPSGRRMRHDSRPQEMRANEAVVELERTRGVSVYTEAILALAIAIEEPRP